MRWFSRKREEISLSRSLLADLQAQWDSSREFERYLARAKRTQARVDSLRRLYQKSVNGRAE